MTRIWTRSIREEIIGGIWLIAGLLAWNDGIKWLAWVLFVKASFDTLASIIFAIAEHRKEKKNHDSEGTE